MGPQGEVITFWVLERELLPMFEQAFKNIDERKPLYDQTHPQLSVERIVGFGKCVSGIETESVPGNERTSQDHGRLYHIERPPP